MQRETSHFAEKTTLFPQPSATVATAAGVVVAGKRKRVDAVLVGTIARDDETTHHTGVRGRRRV